jgi:hypothetical protein
MDFCTTAIIKKINGPDFWNYVLEKGLEEDLLPMPNFTERCDKDRAVVPPTSLTACGAHGNGSCCPPPLQTSNVVVGVGLTIASPLPLP